MTRSQAQALAEIAQRRTRIEQEWRLALKMLDLEPGQVAGGDLASAEPHLMVKDADPA